MKTFLSSSGFALCLALLTLSGCKDVAQEFSGLSGRVAWGPLNGATIRVFDASLFIDHASNAGLLAQGTSNQRGDFTLAIPDQAIGRTLIVAALFPADDPGTPEDERALHINFDGAGNEVRLEPEDGPWYAMVDFFEGQTVSVSVTPLTTLAFHSLASLPEVEAGPGNARYIAVNARGAQFAVAASLGLAADPARVLPAQPAFGGNHPSQVAGIRDASPDSAAALATLVQLDHAARAFALATADGGDDERAFLRALFADARDGVIDGMVNGVGVAYLSQAGAPDVIGQTTDGSSKLVRFLRDAGALSAAEETAASAGGIFPSFASLYAAQEQATGAIRSVRVDALDGLRIPHEGNTRITLTGAGFQRAAQAILASSTASDFEPAGDRIVLDANGFGGGSIVSLRHDEIVVDLPDLSTPGAARGFRIASESGINAFNLFLRFDLDGAGRAAARADRLVGEVIHAKGGGLAVLASRVIRTDADGSRAVPSAMVAYPVATDPGFLVPAVDDVYELECTLWNGGGTTLTGVNLDFGRSTFSWQGGGVAVARFGEGGTPLLIFERAVDLAAKNLTLAPGETETLNLRFAADQARVGTGSNPNYGDALTIAPVFSGSAGASAVFSDDNTLMSAVPLRLSLADRDAAPVVTSGGIAASASAVAGTTFAVDWSLTIAGRSGPLHRSVTMTALRVELAPTGETTAALRLVAPLASFPDTGNSARIEGLTFVGGATEIGLPLLIAGDAANAVLTLATAAEYAGNVTVTLTAEWREPATGISGSLSDSVVISITAP